jgi:hypothetical protein
MGFPCNGKYDLLKNGDLNNNGVAADAGDLAVIKEVSVLGLCRTGDMS